MSTSTRRPSGSPPADPSALLESLHQQLRDAIDALESGEQWQAWLDFGRKLHSYSFRNLILIFVQRPEASQVAGYNSWRSLGRQVRRGERAIRVLAPVTRKAPVLEADGNPRRGPDGKPIMKQQVVGFRPAPVFDISQTDGPPLPAQTAPELLAGNAPEGLWAVLAAEVTTRGYQIFRGPVEELGGANGLTKVTEREVWVRDDVDPRQAAKSLAHELAHIILHVENGVVAGCRGVIEVEAESVAHLVLGAHHVDTGGYTFPYVAAWAHPIAAAEQVPMSEIVARTGAQVMKAADQIITATTAAEATAADPLAPVTGRAALLTRQVADLRDQARNATPSALVERDVLLGVVADGHDFYRRQVASSWVPDYLAERGLGVAVVRSRQLGYAPAGWTAVTDHLRVLGYTDAHIEAAGMATRARTGRLIDRMRDRLIIPLRDTRGDVIAFTGRTAPDTDAPKYLNTPTTELFQKAQVLYGLWENHPRTDRRTPVICEGPLDAIAVDLLAGRHRLNIFGVAASGTAFTPDHARLLEPWIQEGRPICLAFDADRAGVNATEKTWRLITDTGWRRVTAAELPDGYDPADTYAREPARLLESLTTARPAGVVIAERQIASADLAGNVAKEVAAFRDLFPLAARLPPEGRADYVRMLTDTLRIDRPLASMLIAETNGAIVDRGRQFECLDGLLGSATARPQMIVLDARDAGDRRSLPAASAASDREPRRACEPAREWWSPMGGPHR